MKKVLLGVLGAAAFIGLLTWLTVGGDKVRVEVCMQHRDRSACKIAVGDTRDAAIRTGIDNACALIAFGVTENGQCSRSQPLSVRVLE